MASQEAFLQQRVTDEGLRRALAQSYDWTKNKDGLPLSDSAVVQAHLQAREELIAGEKEERSDHAFRQSLSPTARKACEMVSLIRAQERREIWTPSAAGTQDDGGELFPGMMFSLAKPRMEATKLWRIVQRMPKGALLHAHMGATVDVRWLVRKALETAGMFFSSPVPLDSENARETAVMQFGYSNSVTDNGMSVWKSDYVPDTKLSLVAAADSFPLGGREGFIEWIRSRTTITQDESLQHHLGVDAIWRKFTGAFVIIASIVNYEPIFRAFVQQLLKTLSEDGVRWVDMREAFVTPYLLEGREDPEIGFLTRIRHFGEEVEKFKASEAGKEFWGARLIWTSIRSQNTTSIIQNMKQCIEIKRALPHLIAGYDLVGQEDLGRTLKDLLPELLWFRAQCTSQSLTIPFFFHAGECLGDGDSTDANLFDAILLGTRRLGHGFSLYKHPSLIRAVRARHILVESCPISNEVLRLTASVLSHPLPALLARGVPAALCNDDPALLGPETSGMTHDFWQALQGWENLGLAGLGALAENSVRWAAFEDQDDEAWRRDVALGADGAGVRARHIREWRESWEGFCPWVVDEFGDGV